MQAASWSFGEAIDVTPAQGERVFHHLDSAGRKSIAVRDGTVGVVWEDNRDGMPRCYFARKAASAAQFAQDVQLSGKDECYEPSVAALSDGRFVAVFEEGGRTKARVVTAEGAGEAIALGEHESAQASVGIDADVVYAVWTEKDGRFSHVRVGRLAVDKQQLRVTQRANPDPETPKDDQLYPTIAPARTGEVAVAWEDRRNGHTFIVQTFAADGEHFNALQQVNETRSAAQPNTSGARSRNLGRGPGAMRAALARRDAQHLAIVWMDKRDFLSGYDIYAAFSKDGGRTFGKNEKAQDSFGDTYAQWHPAIAARGEDVVVVWDDDRDGTADIWLAWKEGDGWSGDNKPGAASGPGIQTDPSIALDERGDVHLVWIEKQSDNGPTRLRYLSGKR